jgi:membrane protein DedA with SNARE-associated domain
VAEPADPADPANPPPPQADTSSASQEWWDDPRLPWRGKPTRNDILCWAGFSFTGIYALVLLPLRPILLGANPYLLAALGGSRISAVTIGALAAVGHGNWPLGLLLGTFGIIKFHPLYWWAGKLWGRGLIEIVAGRSSRAARGADRAEKLAVRYGPLAIFLTYLVPLPSAVVYASLGATGMSLRRFLLLDAGSALLTRGFFVFLGYQLGQPAVDVVEVISRYSWYLSIALLIGIVVNLIWQSRRRRASAKQAPPTSGKQPSPPDLRSG